MVNVQELEEQEKEKNQVRSELVHSAENAAIREGLQSHDASLGGEVIKQVFGNILKTILPSSALCERQDNLYFCF
jgi:hypothetical protein